MNNKKNKKAIAIIVILIIIFSVSLLTYGRNKKNVFKDEYMNNIFIEEDENIIEGTSYYDDSDIEVVKINNNENKENETPEVKNKIVVEIKGEVVKPDVYLLDEGSIIKDLIDIADGLTDEADISNINRAKELSNHELIIIYNINDEDRDNTNYALENDTESNNIININTATESELQSIPGVGEVKAKSIIIYREKNGGFKKIEEIKSVDGIGEKTFEKIKEFIKL
ncbi:ComEA family DNA-binding protein [Clostridium celatum]|uniref:ComEA family DNA-binding protein n=1 Tax=Clostridium celatum TaxID=36834 RepID=UPI001899BD49|nr:ComEA family DNA-binding protein [Clostridium celatum]MDU2265131.1 ComEA family DNA-binding protein [Clostridium celatum]MDU3721746.1 ComEA family DNA-binding protein [Clostridium celatum]MDU6295104.1 ComEA family DNA-binding protein [Clostridium celatum]